jgi:DNA-binding NarL/FixJ family response regulator
MPITVSIVEDNDKLRGTLARVLNRAEGFRCVSQHPSAEDALKELPGVKPDVVLMDINLPGMNGVECVRQLKTLLPETQVMMLTVYEDTENIFNALAAGANGYMLLSQGLMYKEISDKLQISYETVHTYIRRIYEKLQVRTRTEAVAKFLRR